MDKAASSRIIINELSKLQAPKPDDVHRLKLEIGSKYHLQEIPSNADIIAALTPTEKNRFLSILRRKTTRIISGVTVVAVMTKPYACPQTEPCAYCPGGPATGSPQSYTGHEPAAMRGGQNEYDPYQQVISRLRQLTAIGHKIDKIRKPPACTGPALSPRCLFLTVGAELGLFVDCPAFSSEHSG